MIVLLAAAVAVLAADGVDPLTILLNYGAVGLLLGLFVLGKVHSDSEVRELRAQNAKLADALAGLQTALTGQTIPALTRSAQVFEAMPESEVALMKELQRTVDRLERLAGGQGDK